MVVKGEVCTGVRCVLQCVQAHILLSGKHTLLSGKQATVNNGDLSIARTSGLQTALDGLATDVSLKTNSSLFTSVTNTLDGLIVANAASVSANTTAVAGKQDTIAGTFTPTLATFTTPVTMNSDLSCVGAFGKQNDNRCHS